MLFCVYVYVILCVCVCVFVFGGRGAALVAHLWASLWVHFKKKNTGHNKQNNKKKHQHVKEYKHNIKPKRDTFFHSTSPRLSVYYDCDHSRSGFKTSQNSQCLPR